MYKLELKELIGAIVLIVVRLLEPVLLQIKNKYNNKLNNNYKLISLNLIIIYNQQIGIIRVQHNIMTKMFKDIT